MNEYKELCIHCLQCQELKSLAILVNTFTLTAAADQYLQIQNFCQYRWWATMGILYDVCENEIGINRCLGSPLKRFYQRKRTKQARFKIQTDTEDVCCHLKHQKFFSRKRKIVEQHCRQQDWPAYLAFETPLILNGKSIMYVACGVRGSNLWSSL